MSNKSEDEKILDIGIVKEEQGFDEKEIVFQKVFWVLMIAFLLSGGLGVFGDGGISKQNMESTAFTIEYERFARYETPTTLQVVVKNPTSSLTSISIDNEYLKKIKIEKVIPEPESVHAHSGISTFNFKVSENGLIIFYLEPQYSGSHTLEIDIMGERKNIAQFVYL